MQNLRIRLLTQHYRTQTNWVVKHRGALSAAAATSHEKLGGRPEKCHRQNRRCWADEAGDVRTDCSLCEVRRLYCPGGGQDWESQGFEAKKKKNLKKEVHWMEGVWGKAAQSCGMATVMEKGGAESFGLASIWMGDKVCEGLLGKRWQGYQVIRLFQSGYIGVSKGLLLLPLRKLPLSLLLAVRNEGKTALNFCLISSRWFPLVLCQHRWRPPSSQICHRL